VRPRVGVYVCHCGINIAATVDAAQVVEEAAKLPGVAVARDYPYVCSDPGQDIIRKDIDEGRIDRVVIAACTPTMHEATFRRLISDTGVNPYLLSQANIREQCSWVHHDRREATLKAVDLVRSAVARAGLLKPLRSMEVDVEPAALVVGAGIAGMQSALDIADAGFQTYLVEREPTIGGHMAQLDKTFPTLDCSACILTPRMVEVGRHENISLLTSAEVTRVDGYVGNFSARIVQRARYVDTKKCTGCLQCVEACPVQFAPFEPPPAPQPVLQEGWSDLLDEALSAAGDMPQGILAALQRVNQSLRYLPAPVLAELSRRCALPLATLYHLATFYSYFSLEPRGEHLLQVCMGTACHVAGAAYLVDEIERHLGIGPGGTTDDGVFSLEAVRCIGCCALAPVLRVDEDTYGHLKPEQVGRILDKYAEKAAAGRAVRCGQ
jgi:NADH:ubiquinone oxidoreductase subunit E/NAD-dependent dihydropyrimidine dehydrogenase PreA subunit